MQRSLFAVKEFLLSTNYEELFRFLPSEPLLHLEKSTGRPPYPRTALFKALIYMGLRRIDTLTELVFHLREHPSLSEACGFDLMSPPPEVERFSSFLRDTDHQVLVNVRNLLAKELIHSGQITGKVLSMDSCPLVAPLRENNLKTTVKARYDKERRPKGDPHARLGVIVLFPDLGKRRIQYYWGYRNHAVVDSVSELPLWEVTRPANVHESSLFIPLFEDLRKEFNLPIRAVVGDSALDAEHILNYISKVLGAQPIIARNPRHDPKLPPRYAQGKMFCIAGLEMARRGSSFMSKKNRRFLIFVCPIHHYKKLRKHIWVCPINHPKFFKQRGCCHTIRIDDNIRGKINYQSQKFKDLYNKHTASERVFSRLLRICMESVSVRGFEATRNRFTIAHITVLLVALAAAKTGHKDKIRYVRSFVPNFLVL